MPRIIGVTTAVPAHTYTQAEAKEFVLQLFGRGTERLLPVFDNARIDRRHFAVDTAWYAQPHDFTETNDLYIQTALDLAEDVVTRLAAQCGIGTEEFDAIFFVSTTGLSTPSIDARLFNRMALSRHITRVPIWGLGCAAGAGGIARAADYVTAYPTRRALVVSVELCSLAFQRKDQSKSNIIATALFADGAAACLLVGDDVPPSETPCSRPRILGSLSTIYPDTLDVMGWRISSRGFDIMLSRDIPSIVTGLVRENIGELVERHSITLRDITRYIAHPGGTKVMEAYMEALQLEAPAFQLSFDVLRDYGNMSSATVFFILERVLRQTDICPGEYGMISALGPGFSSELVLLQWD